LLKKIDLASPVGYVYVIVDKTKLSVVIISRVATHKVADVYLVVATTKAMDIQLVVLLEHIISGIMLSRGRQNVETKTIAIMEVVVLLYATDGESSRIF
jgi:uncharacterized protein YueI